MRPHSSHFIARPAQWISPSRRSRLVHAAAASGRIISCWLIGFLALSYCPAVGAANQPPAADQESLETQHSLYYGVYLPSQRSAARALSVAKEMLSDGRYAESLPIVLRVLDAAEDSFGSQNAQLLSLKRQAREVIFRLPPEGYQAYLLEVEAASKREFQQAVQSSPAQLAEVAARFPRTEAGRAASWLLAQRALDYGNPAEAAGQIRDLLNDPGLSEADKAALRQQLAWAEQSGAAAPMPLDGRGNLAFDKPAPHFWAEWVCEYPADPSWSFLVSQDLLGVAAPAGAGYPLVVDRWVLVRGHDGLYAIDQNTGKLGWQAALAAPDTGVNYRSRRQDFRGEGSTQELVRQQLDAVNSRISSNGALVFALNPAKRLEDRTRTHLWALRARRDSSRWDSQSNEIVAVDIPSEGKLAWRTSGDPAFKQVYFLDAPLSVSGRLYALGEFEQTIFLFQLDPVTGALVWKQPVATVESPVEEESLRTTCGGTLCAANGLILCSTGVGLLVAVDPSERSLEWVYRVPAEAMQEAAKTSPWGRGHAYRESQDESKRWLQNRIVIHGDRAFLATPESQRLSCVNLHDGREEWTVRHGYPQLLCCANDEVVVMAAEDRLLGLSPESGEALWRVRWPTRTAPSGGGALFGDHFLQPLSDGSVLIADFHDGTLGERLKSGPTALVGNLAVDGDCVYSQSFAQVSKFRIPTNQDGEPEFAAQVAATQGDTDQAIRMWRKAYRQQGVAAREPLRESLLASLQPTDAPPDQLELLGELSQERETPSVIKVARLQQAVEQREASLVASEIRKACQSPPAERLLLMSPEFAVSFSQLYRSAAEQTLSPNEMAALRAAMLRGAGPAQRRVINEILKTRPSVPADSWPAASTGYPSWGSRQVRADLQPRTRPKSNSGNNSNGDPVEIQLTLDSAAESQTYNDMTLYVNSDRMLIGRNRYGETVLLVELPNGLFDQLEKLLENREVVAFVRGDRFFLPTGPDIISFRIVNGHASSVWQAVQSIRRSKLDSPSPSGSELQREIAKGLSGEATLLSVGQHGVIVTARDLLACLDPQTGAVRWVRTGLKTSPLCTAGEQYAYSAPQTRPGWRVRLGSGELEETVAPNAPVLATSGHMIASWKDADTAKQVVVHDRLTGRDVLSLDVSPSFKHGVVGELLAIVEDSGLVQVVDVSNGAVVLRDELESGGTVDSITAQRHGDRLVLVLNLTERSDHERRGVRSLDRNPISTGPVYCYDLSTGQRSWKTPAMVSEMSLLSRRPSGCPFLVFAANARTDEGGNRRSELRLLVLDAATGRKLYQGSGLKNGRARQYRVRYDAGPRPHGYVTFDNCRLELTALNAPAPPAPPFVAGVEATPDKDFWQMRAELGRWLQAPTEKAPDEAPQRHNDDD